MDCNTEPDAPVGNLPGEEGLDDGATLGTGVSGAVDCGAMVKLQLKVDPLTQRIEDATFKSFGCGTAIASAGLASEWLKGKTLEQALAMQSEQPKPELALPPVPLHCSALVEDAIRMAIGDFQEKIARSPRS